MTAHCSECIGKAEIEAKSQPVGKSSLQVQPGPYDLPSQLCLWESSGIHFKSVRFVALAEDTWDASFRLALRIISWSALATVSSEEFLVIRCPTCGNDVVYSPVPSLYFCLEQMLDENITISLDCKPWILEDAPVADLLKMTERIEKLAVELRL